ncbi:MAG TPA: ABC transporter substrate-binding protein [Dissulfurispiraceae bacterium]|nr:ABC transporter substrate-binding protein [Dissulfurispiraceae bacterium]
MSRLLPMAAALILVFLAAISGHAQEPVKIGAIFSVTGGASFLGEPEKNTVLMLKEQINKAGGINGHPVEVIIEDSKSDESAAVLAAKKLIERDKVVAIIGPSTTGESMAVLKIATNAQVPLISAAAGSGITQPVEDRYWIFKTAQYDTSAVEAIYAHLKKQGINTIGIISVTSGFGDAGRKALQEMSPKFGISIVADERYGPKDADMTTQLAKIKASGAKAVINWSIGPGQVVVAKNWTALKMGVPLYQSHGWGSKKNIELAGKSAEGVIAPLSRLVVWDKLADKHPQKAALKKYSQEYEARFKGEPGAFGGYAYDALMLVVEASRKAGADRKTIRNYIENSIKKWPGVSGVFTMSPKDHCGLDKEAFEMVVVKNGDWEILK